MVTRGEIIALAINTLAANFIRRDARCRGQLLDQHDERAAMAEDRMRERDERPFQGTCALSPNSRTKLPAFVMNTTPSRPPPTFSSNCTGVIAAGILLNVHPNYT